MKKLNRLSLCTAVMMMSLSLNASTAEAGKRATTHSHHDHAGQQNHTHNQADISQEHPMIQVALLVDGSNSMDGLLNQTRQSIWDAVEEFSRSRKNGLTPRLEVAVYEYGKSDLPQYSGYLRQLVPLTTDLDRVSEALFSIRTNGGSEHAGQVIEAAVSELDWSPYQDDLKVIFLAGNESANQGPVPYYEAINHAKSHSIVVNTVFAGPYGQGGELGWRDAASLAGGNYMAISQNKQIVHIVAPQDKRIAELNSKLNETYIPYGNGASKAKERQVAQDANSESVSLGMLSKRIQAKASSAYSNAEWDLVDKLADGHITMEEVETEALPASMAVLNEVERKQYIETKTAERQKVKNEIKQLAEQRQAFIEKEKLSRKEDKKDTFGEAFTSTVKKQGADKGYSFE